MHSHAVLHIRTRKLPYELGSSYQSCNVIAVNLIADTCRHKLLIIMQDISECSSIVEDPGYCTQSNSLGFSLTNNVLLPSPEYLEATSTQLQPTTMHRSRPKKNRGLSNVYITNNYFNSVPMYSTSGCSSLPFTQLHQVKNLCK